MHFASNTNQMVLLEQRTGHAGSDVSPYWLATQANRSPPPPHRLANS